MLFLLVSPLGLSGQMIELEFRVADLDTGMPIDAAHAFISNASYGTTSDKFGVVKMSIPTGLKEDLIISHISYDTKVIRYSRFISMSKENEILLTPNGINLEEIVVVQKRSKKWKKHLKRFTKAFIGED